MKKIKKSQIKAMVNEAVEDVIERFALNEGDSYEDNPEIEKGIQALSKVQPQQFASWVAKNNVPVDKQVETIYNKFFSKVDKAVIAQQAGKNANLTKVLKNLGGFVLVMSFGMYCAKK